MRCDTPLADGDVPGFAHAEHWAKSAFREVASLVHELPPRLGLDSRHRNPRADHTHKEHL
jgi:hypothetical protein